MEFVTKKIKVGKYELGRTLGEGSFAKVKFAKNMETRESVAIKVIDKEKFLKQNTKEVLNLEISIMKLVKHPNIVQLLEVLASKKKIYIVLEFVKGGDFYEKIARQGRLKEDEARKYFQQLINAVDYCHSRGVYHRDLKPENLLVDEAGNLKISDFGFSNLSQNCREDGLFHTMCGTLNYVAPEILSRKGYNGAISDVWSCGVILYIFMAGYFPFDESNIMTLNTKICHAEFTFPTWFSFGAKKLILRILDPNPTSRITIAQILKIVWFKKNYEPVMFKEDESGDFADVIDVFSDSMAQLVEEKESKLT